MLPSDHLVLAKVRDVGNSGLAAGFDDHPADVGPEKAVVGTVRVEISVCVTMVGTMTTGPPLDGSLDRAGASNRKEVLQKLGPIIGSVGPETMVASRDT
jgi:hypothetical protein